MRLDLALRLNSLGTWRRGGGVTPAFATNVYSFNGNVLDGETCTIGTTVYRFVTVLSVAYDVLIGASASITILNLIAAVNAGAGEGTVYGTDTFQHPDVTASDIPGAMVVTARIIGSAGNSIVTTDTAVNASWGAATLTGGAGPTPSFDPIQLLPIAWYDPSDLSTLFQDSAGTIPVTTDGDPVGRLADKSGLGHHLLQATALLRPIYRTDGQRHWIESDGTQWIRALFTVAHTYERVSALRQTTWTSGDRIFGGGTAGGGVLAQTGVTPNIIMTSGSSLDVSDPALDTDFILTERYTGGATSRGAINSDAYITGNAGAILPGGITVFATSGGIQIANARSYGIIMWEGTRTDDQIANARAWLAAKQVFL